MLIWTGGRGGAGGFAIYIFDSAPQFPKIKSVLLGSLKIIAISPCSLKLNRLSPQLPKTPGRAHKHRNVKTYEILAVIS